MLGDTDQPEMADIPNLHEDELVSILRWLPAKQLIQLEWVSPEWKDVLIPRLFAQVKRISLNDFISKSTKWRNSSAGDDNICGLDIFKKLLSLTGSQLTSISLNSADSQLGPEELHLLATECPQLNQLELTKVAVNPSALCQLGSELKLLESLVIKEIHPDSNYSWPAMWNAFSIAVALMPNLKHLKTRDTPMGRDFLSLLPSTVISVDIETVPALFEDFLRYHPRLQQLRLNSSHLAGNIPAWLAQYYPELTHLHLSSSDIDVRLTMSFAGVFGSLSHLKEFELGDRIFKSFTDGDLQDLCANCPNLEVLVLSHLSFNRDNLTLANAMSIGRLTNLKRLELPQLMISNKSVATICEGVGATLESIQLRSNALNDTSLMAISRNCPNLANLHLSYNSFSQAGMTNFIREITSHPSWSGSTRNLRIGLGWSDLYHQYEINLDPYGGRVKLIKN